MVDETDPATTPPPLHRREVFRTVRGAHLSARRGRSAYQPQQEPDATAEAHEEFAKRPYSEPND